MSISLFLYIKNKIESKNNIEIRHLIKCLINNSFGIYLVHYFIRDVVSMWWQLHWEPGYLYLLIVPVIVLLISWATVELLSLNNKIKKTLFVV